MTGSVVRVEHNDRVAVVTIDNPPVNALSRAVRAGLIDAFTALASDRNAAAIVLTGANGVFVAGADLKEMSAPPEAPHLPDVIAAIELLPQPILAAIDGPALGGGLELALSCDERMGSSNASLGLTETKLGIIPGAGGTQRLARLVGIKTALELVGEGRVLKANEARAAGILDEIVTDELLAAAIIKAARAGKRRLSRSPLPAGDAAAEESAAKRVLAMAKGLPAVAEAVRLIRAARTMTFAEAVAEERATFLKLRDSAEAAALRHVFFAEREAGRVPELKGIAVRPVARMGVIGAGTMGAAIAASLADAGLTVDLVERDEASASQGKNRVRLLYDRQVKSKRISIATGEERLDRIEAGANWARLGDCDVVIEAAFEDLAVKTDIFRRLDAVAKPGAILATNTSYLDIDAIAAATSRPEDVIGLHFFAPAHIMRLVEVVRASRTAPDALATAMGLAKRIGKQAIIARNCDGFIGNRIYAVYRRHAEYLVEDGASPHEVDAALEAWGFAMGPFAVGDLSGLDIGFAMRRRRDATRDAAERYVAIPDRLVEAGRLGRKTGGGWYKYDAEGNRAVDPVVTRLIEEERARKGIEPRSFTPDEICRRLLAVMANEGAKELEERVALRASDIDLAFIHGYGFPRYKGGPMWMADRAGLKAVLAEVEAAHAVGGAGSGPAALLVELACSGRTFSDYSPTT